MKTKSDVVRNLKRNYQRSAVIFTFLCLLAFSVLMTFMNYYADIHVYEAESLKVMSSYIDKDLNFDVNELVDSHGKHHELQSRIDLFMKMGSLVDFRIWNDNYRLVYSYSDKNSIGEYFRDNDDLQEVYMSGRFKAGISKGMNAETEVLRSKGTLFELYSPIITNGKITGVLEVYRMGPQLDFFSGSNLMVGLLSMIIPLLLYLLINKHFNKASETIINIHEELQDAYGKTSISYIDTIISLTRALEMRDMETEGHSERVVNLSLFIGKKLGLSEAELGRLVIGSYLHDIGKIGIPDSVLLKPGRLDPDERKIIEKHVNHGYEIIRDVKFLSQAKDVILYHHEKWDGTGYPEGIKGDDIPLNARIFALVDVFDALISERPYKPAYPVEKALNIIREGRGTHFDPAVADTLLDMTPEEVMSINQGLNKERVVTIVYASVTNLMENIDTI